MQKLKNININQIFFIDIETVRAEEELKKGTPLYESFEYKMRYAAEADKFGEGDLEEIFKEKSPLYAEFAKVVCITIGRLHDGQLKMKSWSNEDELTLLQQFRSDFLAVSKLVPMYKLAGHSIKGFDLPFLMRRFIVHQLPLLPVLDVAHLKPWEMENVIDISEIWKSTSWYSASLINMAVALGLPSPKSDMDGSMVSDIFWKEKDLAHIEQYCEGDVRTAFEVYKKMAYIK